MPQIAHTMVHQIEHWAKNTPSAPALHGQRDGRWFSLTWSEYWNSVRDLAKGLIALGHEPGDCVAIVGPNEPEWVQYQFGIQAARGVPAPLYPNNTPEQMAYIISNCRAKIGVCADADLLQRYLDAEASGGCEKFEKILTFTKVESADPRVMDFAAVKALGREQSNDGLDPRLKELDPDETCLLIYTSGTTGMPKGVMLSHTGQLAVGRGVLEMYPAFKSEVPYRAVSYLPLSHQAEQTVTNVCSIMMGGEVYFCPKLEDIKSYLTHVHPTVFLGVPRVWEKFQAALESRLSEATGLKAKLATWARNIELARAQREFKYGRPVVSVRREIARKLVINKVKAGLGLDQLAMAATGAAPISEGTLEFFASLGICLHDAYGMTETSGVATMTPHNRPTFGTVGRALDSVEVRIARDGEIQLRGPGMTKGYLHMPEETEALYAEEGWLCTGDLGSLDAHGNLSITGRKKELLITAGGKNVAPVEMENYIKEIDGVGQVMVVGDRMPYLCALITLDPENLDALAAKAGVSKADIDAMAADPKVKDFIEKEIAAGCNKKVARYQTIKKIALLPGEWTPEGGEMTPTMKLKRGPIGEKYVEHVDQMYAGVSEGSQASA